MVYLKKKKNHGRQNNCTLLPKYLSQEGNNMNQKSWKLKYDILTVGTRFVITHEWRWDRMQRAPTIWFVESGLERHDLGHRWAV